MLAVLDVGVLVARVSAGDLDREDDESTAVFAFFAVFSGDVLVAQLLILKPAPAPARAPTPVSPSPTLGVTWLLFGLSFHHS